MPAHVIIDLMYLLGTCIGLSLLAVTVYFIWASYVDYSGPLKDARDCCNSCNRQLNWLHFKYKNLEARNEMLQSYSHSEKNSDEDGE